MNRIHILIIFYGVLFGLDLITAHGCSYVCPPARSHPSAATGERNDTLLRSDPPFHTYIMARSPTVYVELVIPNCVLGAFCVNSVGL